MQKDWDQVYRRLTSALACDQLDEQLWNDIEELSLPVAEEVLWRAEALVAQLAEMEARKKATIFFLPLKPALSAEAETSGRCWLCGEPLPAGEPGEHFRCNSCATAARLVLWRSIRVTGSVVSPSPAASVE
jgi:hypothetical protein